MGIRNANGNFFASSACTSCVHMSAGGASIAKVYVVLAILAKVVLSVSVFILIGLLVECICAIHSVRMGSICASIYLEGRLASWCAPLGDLRLVGTHTCLGVSYRIL